MPDSSTAALGHATVAQLMRQAERTFTECVAAEDLAGRSLRYGELRLRSNRLANALLASCPVGSRVAYVGRNWLEFLETDVGLAKAGLVKVPIYFRLSTPEVVAALVLCDVQAMIADAEAAERLSDAVAEMPHRPRLISFGVPKEGWEPYEDVLAQASTADPMVEFDARHSYQIRLTSGSTGKPKGVLLSHLAARTAILGNLWILASECSASRPRNLLQAPVTLAAGWTITPTLVRGGSSVFVEQFDPEQVVDIIEKSQIQWSFVVPTMLRRLASASNLHKLRSSALQCLIYGGEPSPTEVIGPLLQVTDSLVQVFGQAEAPSCTTFLSRADHARQDLWASCGKPIPGADFCILDPDGYASYDADASGEIGLKSPSICDTFLGDPAAHQARISAGGWWRTGDVGHFGPEGHLFLDGRGSDLIISGGSNVYPSEVEQAILLHPDIADAVVTGVQDPVWGERPTVLIFGPTVTENRIPELREWLRQRLAAYKVPSHWFVSREPLPRQAEYKVSRMAARQVILDLMATGAKATRGGEGGQR